MADVIRAVDGPLVSVYGRPGRIRAGRVARRSLGAPASDHLTTKHQIFGVVDVPVRDVAQKKLATG